jgi:hypothetical protein
VRPDLHWWFVALCLFRSGTRLALKVGVSQSPAAAGGLALVPVIALIRQI